MNFTHILQKRKSSPVFTVSEIERSLRRSGFKRTQIQDTLKTAVINEDLVRLRYGLYCLPKKHRARPVSPFEVLERLDSNSYLTHISALSYYDLIPEALGLNIIFSEKIINGQNSFRTPLGNFKFKRVNKHLLNFGINHLSYGGYGFRIATPLRAILDYSLDMKRIWESRDHLISDLRLDEDELENVNWKDLRGYKTAYSDPHIDKVCENLND